jgi:hypothetical protein
MADAAAAGPPVAAAGKDKEDRRRLVVRCAFAVAGIMSTLLVYGVLQVPPSSPRPRPSPFHPPGVSRAAGSLSICRVSPSPHRRICHSARCARSGFACFPFCCCHQMRIRGRIRMRSSFCRMVLAHNFTRHRLSTVYAALALAFLAGSINRSSRNFRFTLRAHANPRLWGTNHATS